MARFLNRWIGRHKSAKYENRKRSKTRRSLKPEALEKRQLLAANLFHNELLPEDVNEDGVVTALDALTIINRMGRQSRGDVVADNQRGPGQMTDVNNDGRDTALDALMVINRLGRDRAGIGDPIDRPNDPIEQPTDDPPISLSDEVRSVDGSGNNLENSELGAADTPLLRVAENDYADGIAEPSGEDRPSAREISNTLSAADPEGTTSERDLSSFVFAWGQFLDHDIDLSLEPEDELNSVAFDIEVPAGDPLFDPFGTGDETIHLTRSVIADGTGTSIENPAEQVNAITAWVDGSQVYGSDQETADALREFVGGRLLISDDGLLPTDEDGGILAGDIRAAENVVLTSMQTLFVREHNRLADEISAANPELSDEEIYQEARAIVIAEIQSITYNEYLPALLGEDALSEYAGYDSSVDPSIANEFSTAAFRFGHSTLNDEFRLVGNDGEDVDEAISLADAFFTPELLEQTGIDVFLKYASSTVSQEVDLEVVDSLRNFLFGAPGSGGLDLVSLNIQRGRDHGLADYNSTREAYGLDPVESFADISSNEDVQANLESLYGDVDNIDLWVGLLAEVHVENGSLGETATLIIADQFERLRDGDRFYYENTMSDLEIREIENTTLADIIERNTDIDSLQANVFFFAPEITGTVLIDSATVQQSVASQQGRRQQVGDDDAAPAEPILVELIDSDGVVIDSALTDADGQYAFDSVTESGSYQVRIAQSDQWEVVGASTWDLSISNGEEDMSGIDFQITTPASQTETDVVLEWNDLFGEILVDSTENQNPGYASRSQAILNLAIYDAVAIATSGSDAETYYEYDINLSRTDNISAEIAASQAAYTVLSSLYPNQQDTLDAFLETSLSSARVDGSFADSLDVGTEIGNEILAIRASDGSDVIAEYTYTDEIGYFQPDPLNPDVPAWGPAWGEVDTFAISSSDDFVPEATPALTSEAYAASYNEVLELGSVDSETRTADQTEAGIFWAYDREGLGTPIALFSEILQTIAVQEGNTLQENAALFAQASVAMADAGITAWDTKFTEEFWRPVTAIHEGDADGNDLTEGDTDWVALGAPNGEDTTGFTPQFPTYISGHATFGAALFGTLQEFYGTDDISFDVTSAELEILLEDPELQEAYGLDLDDATRSFSSFSEAMAENGRSRVYLGIHFDFDDLVGQEGGQAIAASVASEFVVASDDGTGETGFVNNQENPGNFSGQGGNDNGGQGRDDLSRPGQRVDRLAAVDSIFAQRLF